MLFALPVLFEISARADLRFTLRKGNAIQGRIVERNAKSIVIRTRNGLETINETDILSVDIAMERIEDYGMRPGSVTSQASFSLQAAEALLGGVSDATAWEQLSLKTVATGVEDVTQTFSSQESGLHVIGYSTPLPSEATDSKQRKEEDLVFLKNGKHLSGHVVMETETNLDLKIRTGVLSIPKSEIKIVVRPSQQSAE